MADALTGLYGQLQGRALCLTQNREAANDLVQGVCERALRKQAMFEAGTNLEALAPAGDAQPVHRRAPQPAPVGAADARTDIEAPEDDGAPPLDLLGWEDVVAGIQCLDADDRAVLELAYLRGVAYRDIATLLELKPRTVNTRVFRAKARLRRRLDGGTGRPAERGRLIARWLGVIPVATVGRASGYPDAGGGRRSRVRAGVVACVRGPRLRPARRHRRA